MFSTQKTDIVSAPIISATIFLPTPPVAEELTGPQLSTKVSLFFSFFFKNRDQDEQTKESQFEDLFIKKTTASAKAKDRISRYKKNCNLARLILLLTQQTAAAILQSNYKEFDGLVKNFGCEVTALQVLQLVRCPRLKEEAEEIQGKLQPFLQKIDKITSNEKNQNIDNELFSSSVDDLKIDVQLDRTLKDQLLISKEMSQLIRFRLLNVISGTKEVPGGENGRTIEVPVTDIENLHKLTLNKKGQISKQLLGELVNFLQIEESKYAIEFLRSEIKQIQKNERTEFLEKVLGGGSEAVLSSLPILQQPLLYKVEAVMLRMLPGSLVLLKNKLFHCGEKREAEPLKLFYRMPEERTALTEAEVQQIAPQEPMLVIEGYVEKIREVATQVEAVGLTLLLRIQAASTGLYSDSLKNAPFIAEDKGVKDEIEELKNQKQRVDAITIDHFYCSSKGKE